MDNSSAFTSMSSAERVLLLDNGSLEPASTLQLRRIAHELSARAGHDVLPVSLAHSHQAPVNQLGGRPAQLLAEAFDQGAAEGVRAFRILPLFVGPSIAVTKRVPAMIAERAAQFPGLAANVAPTLGEIDGGALLADILADHIRGQKSPGQRPRVAIVDHGSATREVTDVRNRVAALVQQRLGAEASDVAACSMERREGAEYDFNEPTLERLLQSPGWEDGPLIVALLFVAAGRHAGPDGDVMQICRHARGANLPAVKFTRVLGEHPKLIEALAAELKM